MSRQVGAELYLGELDVIEADVIESLDAAVAAVFSLMLDRSCTPQSKRTVIVGGLCASVRFMGSVRGVCAIHMDFPTARKLTNDLMGISEAEASESQDGVILDPSLPADTIGEICNMIAGSWKSRLSAELSTCALSSPVVTFNPEPQTPLAYHFTIERRLTRFYGFGDHSLILELSLGGQ